MPYVVIIPSFLASIYFNLLPLQATWFLSDASTTYVQGQYLTAPWADRDDDFNLHRVYGRGYLGGIDRFQDSQGVKPTPPVWRLFAIQLFSHLAFLGATAAYY